MTHLPERKIRECLIHGQYYGRFCPKCIDDVIPKMESRIYPKSMRF